MKYLTILVKLLKWLNNYWNQMKKNTYTKILQRGDVLKLLNLLIVQKQTQLLIKLFMNLILVNHKWMKKKLKIIYLNKDFLKYSY